MQIDHEVKAKKKKAKKKRKSEENENDKEKRIKKKKIKKAKKHDNESNDKVIYDDLENKRKQQMKNKRHESKRNRIEKKTTTKIDSSNTKITIKSTNGDDVVKEISVAASSNKTVVNEVMIVDHPFNVDDSDYCETPLKAYQDRRLF